MSEGPVEQPPLLEQVRSENGALAIVQVLEETLNFSGTGFAIPGGGGISATTNFAYARSRVADFAIRTAIRVDEVDTLETPSTPEALSQAIIRGIDNDRGNNWSFDVLRDELVLFDCKDGTGILSYGQRSGLARQDQWNLIKSLFGIDQTLLLTVKPPHPNAGQTYLKPGRGKIQKINEVLVGLVEQAAAQYSTEPVEVTEFHPQTGASQGRFSGRDIRLRAPSRIPGIRAELVLNNASTRNCLGMPQITRGKLILDPLFLASMRDFSPEDYERYKKRVLENFPTAPLGGCTELKPVSAEEGYSAGDVIELAHNEGWYRVLRVRLGGKAIVYQARKLNCQKGEIGTPTCLKQITFGSSDQAEQDQAAAEIHTLIKLRGQEHPNIVSISGAPTSIKGERFVEQEWCEGPTLQQRMEAGDLSRGEIMAAIQGTVLALDHAHSQIGVVHRDVKPANIILTSKGVKVVDWGISRSRGVGQAAEGTPPFSPPEARQATKVTGLPDIDPAKPYISPLTDSYGLGMIIYQLLSSDLTSPYRDLSRLPTNLEPQWHQLIEGMTRERLTFDGQEKNRWSIRDARNFLKREFPADFPDL
ncbi:MAG: protein kinase [Candidatus Pacebacteria bacterium]|nr:protein kinase [Candidatus Paceibacterota bacterium]